MNPFKSSHEPNYLCCRVEGTDQAKALVKEIVSAHRDHFPYFTPRGLEQINRVVSVDFNLKIGNRVVTPIGHVNFRYHLDTGILVINVDKKHEPYEKGKPLQMLETIARYLLETERDIVALEPNFGLKLH